MFTRVTPSKGCWRVLRAANRPIKTAPAPNAELQISDLGFHIRLIAANPTLDGSTQCTLSYPTANMPGTRGPVPVPLETKGQNLTQEILDLLDTKEPLHTNEDFPAVSQAEIKAALDRLASRSMVEYKSLDSEKVLLTPESEGIVAEGSHEFKVWQLVKDKGSVPIAELPVRVPCAAKS